MTDYIVIDGPLTANMRNPDGTRFSAGTVPVGTELFGTGNVDGVWIEAASPYQKSKGVTAWYHKDYIQAKSSTTSVASPKEQREAKVLTWFWGVAGRTLDVDKVPYDQPAQCVDVPKDMANKLFGAPLRAYGNGKDVAYNMGALPGWTRLQYKPGMLLQALDVLSYGKPWGVDPKTKEVYGHTAVQMIDSTKPTVAQQNGFDKNTTVVRTTLDTEGLLWVARPPFVAESTPVGAAGVSYYTMKAGDTLWAVAMEHKLDIAVLQSMNSTLDPNNIPVGTRVRVG